jgi:serine O-acetyltransferase
MMQSSWIDPRINSSDLTDYVSGQLDHFFPDKINHRDTILTLCDEALDKMKYSISFVKLKGFTTFHYLHSDLYAQFIYYLSHLVWTKTLNKILATKLFYLNKCLHGFNCMYDTLLPDIFLFTHPVGSVIGKANYSNYLVICQNVTIGMHRDETPIIGEHVFIGTGSIAADTMLINENIPGFKTISGKSPNLIIKEQKRDILKEMYFY